MTGEVAPAGGPLRGLRVIEIAGLGPGPFAAMMLADLGAEVLRIDRAATVDRPPESARDLLNRGRRSVAVDLKHSAGAEVVLALVQRADALIEGFRPGVAERLGIGPAPCLARSRALVYGRITGWGQDGPYAAKPGHDINYISLTGALAAVGPAGGPPIVPLNLVGDFGGGGMLLALGVLAAVLEARSSGRGQVVDAAMTDGSAALMTLTHSLRAQGRWTPERGVNLLDGGRPFYDVYETADGRFVAVGCLEPQFYAALLEVLGLDDLDPADQMRVDGWPELRRRLTAAFRAHDRDVWEERFAGSEACVAPVLTMDEAPDHPHNLARRTYCDIDGIVQPAPAPRFDRTPAARPSGPPRPGEHTRSALVDWGVADVDGLLASGAVREAPSGSGST